MLISQRSLQIELIFRLLLKITVERPHECDFDLICVRREAVKQNAGRPQHARVLRASLSAGRPRHTRACPQAIRNTVVAPRDRNALISGSLSDGCSSREP